MILTRDYPAMQTPPKSITYRHRSHVDDEEVERHVTQHPPRVRMTTADSIARGEATRKLILEGIEKQDVASIKSLREFLEGHGLAMSITNCRKHLNKLIARGLVERTDDVKGCTKVAILYWLAEKE